MARSLRVVSAAWRSVVAQIGARDVLFWLGLSLLATGLSFVSPAWAFAVPGGILVLTAWWPSLLELMVIRRASSERRRTAA